MADTISNPSMEPLFFSVDPMSLILSQNTDTHHLKLLLDGLCGFERGPKYDEYSRLRESKLRMKRDFQRFLEEEDETQRKKQVKFEGITVISREAEEEEDETQRKKQVRFEGVPVISHEAEEEETQRKNQVRFEGIPVISHDDKFSPEKVKKKVQTRFGFSPRRTPPPSSLAQSVPDFSAVMRKENRRPVNFNATPPPLVSKSRNGGVLMGSGSSSSSSAAVRGSKSASAGEMKKKSTGFMGMARKSYASVEDLKKISIAAASAINNVGVGGGGRKGGGSGGGGGGGRTILGYKQIY